MPHQVTYSLENKEIIQQAYDFVLSKSSDCIFNLEKENVFSSLIECSSLQDSFSFRALFRARQLANLLIDDEGRIEQKNVQDVIFSLKSTGFICYPNGYSDSVITEHEIAVLQQFTSEKMVKLLYRFDLPVCHKAAEAILLDSLGIYSSKLRSTDVRRAVLCASLTPLRQNIGSCFATAPGILVQQEQLALFLMDLYQLLSTGQLKRTCDGNEYVVAMSTSYISLYSKQNLSRKKETLLSPGILHALKACGLIDHNLTLIEQIEQVQAMCLSFLPSCASVTELFQKVLEQKHFSDEKLQIMQRAFTSLCENTLLKAWEFTLASFSEVNPQALNWHLCTALGFAVDEVEGLGSVIYNCLQDKLKTYQQEIASLQVESEITMDQLRSVKSILHRADTSSRIRSLQAEYQSLSHHVQACIGRRDQLIEEANGLQTLLSTIIQYYVDQFPQYFQEIYDPQLVQQNEDDAPAGFRLFYKHGRTDASLWTAIETEEDFSQVLRSFFLTTESLLYSQEKHQQIITEIAAAIVLHVRTSAFLKGAQKRMNSLTPWCYTSGGTMQTLVRNYFCRSGVITVENRMVESPLELLIFLIDILKELPSSITGSKKMLLMNSPGHAFLLLPSEPLFRQGWESSGFTYTWIRDEFMIPNTQKVLLTTDMQEYLLQQISSYKHSYRDPKTPKEWKDETLCLYPLMKADDLDAFLYQQLPLIPASACKEYLQKLLAPISIPKVQEVIERFSLTRTPFISTLQMKRIAKGCLLLSKETIGFSFDVHNFIANAACEIGLSPRCLMFADTNWPGYYLGFLMNPGTETLELWRFDRSGTFGYPMSSWKKWFGSSKRHWSVYVKPFEYLFFLHSYGISSII